MVDVQVLASPVAGGTPVTAGTLVTVPESVVAQTGALVTMGSSRHGLRAGFAWTIPGQPQVNVLSVWCRWPRAGGAAGAAGGGHDRAAGHLPVVHRR